MKRAYPGRSPARSGPRADANVRLAHPGEPHGYWLAARYAGRPTFHAAGGSPCRKASGRQRPSAWTCSGSASGHSMSLRIAGEISARRIGGDENVPPTSEILVDGRPSGRVVSGAKLEAAVEAGEHRLLFLTDDTPFEEMLSIHLLDARWHRLDSAVLGAPTARAASKRCSWHRRTRCAFASSATPTGRSRSCHNADSGYPSYRMRPGSAASSAFRATSSGAQNRVPSQDNRARALPPRVPIPVCELLRSKRCPL